VVAKHLLLDIILAVKMVKQVEMVVTGVLLEEILPVPELVVVQVLQLLVLLEQLAR
jgi:hypothetical protein